MWPDGNTVVIISIDWPHNNYHICPHYILRITLGSSCDTFSNICIDTNWLIAFMSSSIAKVHLIRIQQPAEGFSEEVHGWTWGPSGCCRLVQPLAKCISWRWFINQGGRETAQSLQKGETLSSPPHDHCFHLHAPLQKWRVIRGHFCQQKACVRVSGSVRLPTGQRDSLHSNYGSALFLRSTLEASVQSQTCTEQHEQERGHRQHRQAEHWCHWLLPRRYWI